MTRLLENKVAIVTGSSRGLGLAISGALGVDGAKVLVVSRSAERARDASARVEALGGNAAPCVADLTRIGSADIVVKEALDCFGGVDILVNCAGVFLWKPFLDVSFEEWHQILSTNLTAAFVLTQKVAEVMIDQGRGGSIINISSVHGLVGESSMVPQCASKFGLVGLTRATAEALREFDIRVNAVAPGAMEPDSADRRGESPRERITQADVATLVVYLASDLARSLTGGVMEAFGSTRFLIKT